MFPSYRKQSVNLLCMTDFYMMGTLIVKRLIDLLDFYAGLFSKRDDCHLEKLLTHVHFLASWRFINYVEK